MPGRRPLRLKRAISLALLGLACWWGGSFAIEVDAGKLQKLSASRYGAKGARSVDNWLQLLRATPPALEKDRLVVANDFWNRALLSGDLVEFGATPYAGDAYFKDWPQTLNNLAALNPKVLVPGRGAALTTPEEVSKGLSETRDFIADVRASVEQGVAAGKDLNAIYKDTFAALKPKYGHWVIFDHCMPFDVTRCYDEVTKYADPRIWTAERDVEMWKTLEG